MMNKKGDKDWLVLNADSESHLKHSTKGDPPSAESCKTADVVACKGKNEKEVMIRLLGNRSVHHVSVDHFAAVSMLVKQQQQSGKVMTSMDLHRYSDQSILAFVNFVEKKEVKTSLTYAAIAEMLILAKIFLMRDFRLKLEKELFRQASTSEADLLQALLVCGVSSVTADTERKIQVAAAKSLVLMAKHPQFREIPYFQLVQVLGRCELNVSHEMVVADLALLWLSGQSHPTTHAPAVFQCVRCGILYVRADGSTSESIRKLRFLVQLDVLSPSMKEFSVADNFQPRSPVRKIRAHFLSHVDQQLIVERIRTLRLSSRVVRLAENIMGSHNGQRICVEREHIRLHLPRCGIVESEVTFGDHSSLPLSRHTESGKKRAQGDESEQHVKKKEKSAKSKKGSQETARTPKLMELLEMDRQRVHQSTRLNKTTSKGSKKSRCACVNYVRRKLAKKPKEAKFKFEEPKSAKSPAPKRSPTTSKASRSSASASASTSMKTSSKASQKSSKSSKSASRELPSKTKAQKAPVCPKKVDQRRNAKRDKMTDALMKSKSDTEVAHA